MSLETLIFRPLLLLVHTTDLLLNLPSLLRSSSTQRTPNREQGAAPKHVAFSFVTPDQSEDARERLKTVVEDLAAWAAEVGVDEVSLWSEDGLFDDGVVEISALSSANREATSTTLDVQEESRTSHQDEDEKDPEWITVDHPSDTLVASPPHPSPPTLSEPKPQQTNKCASRTYTIPSDANIPSREVKIHILPRSTAAGGTIIARLTRQLVEEKVPPEKITQETIDARIRQSLGFTNDPCILIIQPLSTPPSSSRSFTSTLRRWLPADPPEIHGYPFWPLRVTEIFLAAEPAQGECRLAEWDRALERWRGVEQRLGR